MEVLVSQEDKTEVDNNKIYMSDTYPYLRIDGKRISLHKFIANRMGLFTRQGEVIDHINGNKFDARRENLRILNHSQNNQNRIMEKVQLQDFEAFVNVYVVLDGRRVLGRLELDISKPLKRAPKLMTNT